MTIEFESALDEAKYVVDWHLHSDKVHDIKHSQMSLEEAESIIADSK